MYFSYNIQNSNKSTFFISNLEINIKSIADRSKERGCVDREQSLSLSKGQPLKVKSVLI